MLGTVFIFRRKDRMPHSESMICSCHFVNGDINQCPSLFEWNKNKRHVFLSPEKRCRKRCDPDKLHYKKDSNSIPVDSRCSSNSPNIENGTSNLSLPIPSSEINFPVLDTSSTSLQDTDRQNHNDNKSPEFVVEDSLEEQSTLNDPRCTSFKSTETQTDHEFNPRFYEAETYFKDREIEHLKKSIEGFKIQKFGVSFLKDDQAYLHYTGLVQSVFHNLCDVIKLVEFEYWGSRVVMFSVEDQVLITLLKLRHNFTNYDLSCRFGCSLGTICNIIHTFILVLHHVLYKCCIEDNIPYQQKNRLCLPGCFQSFPSCRIILDCTEIKCEIPTNMLQQRLTYSSYKGENTDKVLIGISPNGSVTYCSPLYPGSTSDKSIVEHCRIIKHLKPGDLVLADKGFLISELLPTGVSLNVPPFKSRTQFTASEVLETNRIARARIHVERAISRIKGYRILQFIPHTLYPIASKVVQLCAALVNLQSPLIKEIEENYN